MNNEKDNEDVRRVYWSEQMEAAYGFMRHIFEHHVEE